MKPQVVSARMTHLQGLIRPLLRFANDSPWARLAREPGVYDFALGNPHDMPLPEFVQALQRWVTPQNKDWFAYQMNEPDSRRVVAESLYHQRELLFAPEDIFLTNGAFAGLSVSLAAVVDPGDEVIFISPPWFFYEALIAAAGATPVRVPVLPRTFDLDLDAIEAAITERTRGIIINSPHNPTGLVYTAPTLQSLAHILEQAGHKHGRILYLFSDEAYCRILFDGRTFPSPTTFYPHSFIIYTYGKTLLTPGQRLGYIALPPTMPEREELREALFTGQVLTGYAFPNALLQHALPDLEPLSIDVARLQHKRDRLVEALRELGYQPAVPEGTFYLLVRSPWADDWAFVELLGGERILALPGSVAEMPGYFRLSLTANEEMIKGALPGFARAMRQAHKIAA